ncbi:C4-dicarboxylate ABC transporter substrate-binding protein [Oscillospiraceae bacterium]|nr:C4-dicarboxylate ABC transporter substrate-binding protein [Oscillospiraceae bacterium]
MSTKKSALAMLLAGAMTLSLAACGGGNTTESKAPVESTPVAESAAPSTDGAKVGQTVLKLSFNQTLENPEAKTVLELSDKLYDATEGRYSLEVYPSEQLGSQQESLELVQQGAIDMAIVANSIVEGVNPDFAIIGTPYIYDSIEHQKKLFQSGKLDDLFASTQDNGFTVLAAYSLGPRCLYTKELITTPEELAGKKIRVMQSDTMIQMLNNMGGVGTAMAQGDVYSAIQAGTLDGAENNIITYTDLLQYEVAPYYTLTNHLMIPDELIINNDVLGKMSAEDQEALKKLSTESVETMFTLAEELRDQYFTECETEHGVTVTEIDIKPFQDRCQGQIEEIANRTDMTKSVYEAILSLR